MSKVVRCDGGWEVEADEDEMAAAPGGADGANSPRPFIMCFVRPHVKSGGFSCRSEPGPFVEGRGGRHPPA